jgi:hypothetical protein
LQQLQLNHHQQCSYVKSSKRAAAASTTAAATAAAASTTTAATAAAAAAAAAALLLLLWRLCSYPQHTQLRLCDPKHWVMSCYSRHPGKDIIYRIERSLRLPAFQLLLPL